jgi:predicted RNase H-like nuclease (RuvC/YqgF family)
MEIKLDIDHADYRRMMLFSRGQSFSELVKKLIKEAISPATSIDRDLVINAAKHQAKAETDLQAMRERLWTKEAEVGHLEDTLEPLMAEVDRLRKENDSLKTQAGQRTAKAQKIQDALYESPWSLE